MAGRTAGWIAGGVRGDRKYWELEAKKKKDAAPAHGTEGGEPELENLDMDDPVRIAYTHGKFQKGSIIREKNGDQNMLFEIMELGTEVETAQLCTDPTQKPVKATINLSDLVEGWKVRPGPRQLFIDPKAGKKRGAAEGFLLSAAASVAFESLRKAEKAHEAKYQGKILFCLHPREVRTRVALKKGELVFAPLTDVGKMTFYEKGPEWLQVELQDKTTLKMSPPEFPVNTDTTEWTDRTQLAPFFWVKSDPNPSNSNLFLEWRSLGGVHCYCMTNSEPIPAFVELVVHVEKEAKQSLANAVKIVQPSAKASSSSKEEKSGTRPARPAAKAPAGRGAKRARH